MADSSVRSGSHLTLLDQFLSLLESLDRTSCESQSLGGQPWAFVERAGATPVRSRSERATETRYSRQSEDVSVQELRNSKNQTCISVPLSHAQYTFLLDRPEGQNTVKDKLKAKGLDCRFDFENGEMHAEAGSSIDPSTVSSELRKIIVEHDLQVSSEYIQLFTAGTETDLLTSWKTSSVNDAVVVNDKGTVKLVGLADSVDCLGKELKKSTDALDARAAKKTQRRKSKESRTDILPLSDGCFQYLSKFKSESVLSSGTDVTIKFKTGTRKSAQGIEITGPPSSVQKVKDRLDVIAKRVKTTRFMCGYSVGAADADRVAEDVASRNYCIAIVEQSPTSPSVEVIDLMARGNETSVAVVVNELQLQQADVIVNTTHKDLTLGVGRVSTALLKVCGSGVQEELRQKYPDGIKHGELAVTGSGQLTICKDIYHGALPFWKGMEAVKIEKCYECLLLLVYRCLLKASAAGYRSIAFPALGTGALEYPYDNVALLMYRAVRMFLQHNTNSSLEQIYFVLYPWSGREMRQAFFANAITQKIHTTQTEVVLTQSTGRSHSEIFEMMFRVGKSLVKVVNADVNVACHSSSPILILWSPGETQDPQRNRWLSSLCNIDDIKSTIIQKVEDLPKQRVLLDTDSLAPRTLVHCHCPGFKEEDVMTAVQQGLELAKKEKLDTLTLPIPSEGGYSDNPTSMVQTVLKAVKKCSSCVFVVAVFIPDSHVFTTFVTMATTSYKTEKPPSASTTDLVESTWDASSSEFLQGHVTAALRMLPTVENITLSVTSDSVEKNKTVALEIQKALRKKVVLLFYGIFYARFTKL